MRIISILSIGTNVEAVPLSPKKIAGPVTEWSPGPACSPRNA